MTPDEREVQRARTRFVAWLRWYMTAYPEKAPSQNALARLLGITSAGMSYLFETNSTRLPRFDTLLAARRVLGFSLDYMLFNDPPTNVGQK